MPDKKAPLDPEAAAIKEKAEALKIDKEALEEAVRAERTAQAAKEITKKKQTKATWGKRARRPT